MAAYSPVRSWEQNGKSTQGADAAGDEEAHFKQELLVAVQTGDEERLRDALKQLSSNPKAVNYVFPHPVSAAALHVATQNNSLELVKILIQKQANVGERDLRGKRYCPLHYAAQNGNVKILEELLNAGADPNVKEGEFGRTCLHILALKWSNNEDAYKECLDLLLSREKIKVEALDSSKVSPLFLAATKGWEYMVRAMIYKGANVDAAVGNKTASTVIKKKFPGLLDSIDFSVIEKPKRHFSDELYDALINSDLQLFQEILAEIDSTDEKSKLSALEEDHGEYTLLKYACDNGMTEFVEELLKNGANPLQQEKTNCMSPILYAARNGFHKILEVILKSLRDHKKLERDVLKHKDLRKETALHKVVKREYLVKKEGVDYYKCLELLLDRKRYMDLDAQDEFGNTALHYAVLCDDQSFVRTLLLNGANLGIKNRFGTLAITRIQASVLKEVLNECIKYKHNVADREFEIILHYSMLVPSQTSQQPETECLRFLSGSRKHRHLLLHPIIDTFLFLKWQRIKPYYFFNIIAYTIFLILLTSYILLYHGTFVPLTESGGNSEALLDNKGEAQEMETYNFAGMILLKALILIFVLYIALREGVQFYVSWKLYVQRLENWLEISIVCLTCSLLFIPMDASHQQSLCAWLVLFSWIEFVLLLGGHPEFSVYITMFTTVAKNFLKFISMFSFMIVAFSISFFLVFQVNENFLTYYQSLLKTLAMTTGEIEYTDLPLSSFPVSSHLLFVVFVFLIVLVLMNLLNGLAVSDIQQIRQEAEIVSYSSRVELVSYIESVFLSSPFHHILPGSLRCCEGGDDKDGCSNLTASMESYNPAIMLLNWLGRRTLMFQTCLRDSYTIYMFPNRGNDRWHVCDCHSFHLKETQIEAAKDVVLEKEYAVDNHRLSGLENRLDELMTAVSSLTEKVNKHVLCPSPE